MNSRAATETFFTGNFKDKIGYLYYLTPKGIAEKTNITIKFMKLKMKEYDELKKELSSMKSKLNR